MKNLEGNTKLANLLGHEIDNDCIVTMHDAYRCGVNPLGRLHQDMQYDRNWEWLMQVVDKIESLEEGRYQVNILQEGCYITDRCSRIISDKRINFVPAETTKLQSVFLACVEFTDYWNLQR